MRLDHAQCEAYELRKWAAKRRLKEKSNNAIVDLVTTQLKELNSSNYNMSKMLQDLVTATKEEKAHKMMLREQKLTVHKDKIIMMDTSMMTLEYATYYEQRKAEIMQRRSGISSSTQQYVSPCLHYIIDYKNCVAHLRL